MKTSRWVKAGAWGVAATSLLAVVAVSERVQANSSGFSWVMNRRAVNGADNHKLHHLDTGKLTIEGKLWTHEKRAKATAQPMTVTIYVRERGAIIDSDVCKFNVTPSTILNDQQAISTTCGEITSGNYYLIAAKPKSQDEDGDGWHHQAAGVLTTR